MEIISVEEGENALTINARISEAEFEQLHGQLHHLCIFSTSLISTPATIIKTGARQSCAKYILFPSILRRRFKRTTYDFTTAACGVLLAENKLYVIYKIRTHGSFEKIQLPTTPEVAQP